jgi:capsid protein
MPRGWSWVDPLKEVKAYREAEQAGYMSKSQIVAQNGGDYDDTITEIAREQQFAADLDVTLDRDILDPMVLAMSSDAAQPPSTPAEVQPPPLPPAEAVPRSKRARKPKGFAPDLTDPAESTDL